MNGDVTASHFVGAMRASPEKGTYYYYGVLPRAMKYGATLLVDEVDYTPPHIAAVMNSVLEGKRVLYLEETGETIHAAEGFTVIATGNTGGKGDADGMYTGTEVLNTAFLDRFPIKMRMDYMHHEHEEELLTTRFPTEKASDIKKMVRAANEVREAFKQGQISLTFSTRKLLDYFELKGYLGEDETPKHLSLIHI